MDGENRFDSAWRELAIPFLVGLLGALVAAVIGWRMSSAPGSFVEVTRVAAVSPGLTTPALDLDGVEVPAIEEDSDDKELQATCERIAAKLGSVTLDDCIESRLRTSGASSVQGTPILVAEYPPLAGRESLGRVLLFGGIHGDEFSSVSIVYSRCWTVITAVSSIGVWHRWSIRTVFCVDNRSA